ncbi:hypothetical protein [uncultured Croceitalea sp.]|uniref:hypothetical protein n=1 Tax=uncultured Croceitalea sp. TaxID=1798908 RepID=UPI003306040B
MANTATHTDLEQMILRLERNHKCVLRLRSKINSYHYEPKDYECFIRLRNLRFDLKELSEDQMELFDILQRNHFTTEEATLQVNAMLVRYQELDKQIASYLLATKGY